MPVTSVNQSQTIDQVGNTVDTLEFTFTIEGAGGIFTGSVPKAGDPVAAAAEVIRTTEAEVLGILGL